MLPAGPRNRNRNRPAPRPGPNRNRTRHRYRVRRGGAFSPHAPPPRGESANHRRARRDVTTAAAPPSGAQQSPENRPRLRSRPPPAGWPITAVLCRLAAGPPTGAALSSTLPPTDSATDQSRAAPAAWAVPPAVPAVPVPGGRGDGGGGRGPAGSAQRHRAEPGAPGHRPVPVRGAGPGRSPPAAPPGPAAPR